MPTDFQLPKVFAIADLSNAPYLYVSIHGASCRQQTPEAHSPDIPAWKYINIEYDRRRQTPSSRRLQKPWREYIIYIK